VRHGEAERLGRLEIDMTSSNFVGCWIGRLVALRDAIDVIRRKYEYFRWSMPHLLTLTRRTCHHPDWQAYEAARQKFMPNLSRNVPAARYRDGAAVGSNTGYRQPVYATT
jgi:hypothetical protein